MIRKFQYTRAGPYNCALFQRVTRNEFSLKLTSKLLCVYARSNLSEYDIIATRPRSREKEISLSKLRNHLL